MLRASLLAVGLALIAAGSASAEIVARGVQDGLLAVGSRGAPYVAYVRGTKVLLSTRTAKNRWHPVRIGSAPAGSQVMAFAVGARGPVALVQTADDRRLFLIRRVPYGWQTIRLAGSLPPGIQLGWPGLALDGKGLPVVGYARWTSTTFTSRLFLVRVDARGKTRAERITLQGFPQSFVPPPAAPVFVRGRVDVVESYGFKGVVGTIEWYPNKRTWTGLFLSAGIGDFPVGPVLAVHNRAGRIYAAWTESIIGAGEAPVALAERGREASTDFVLDRALTTGLVLAGSRPEIAANEWVEPADLGLEGETRDWAGTVLRGETAVELDGWIAGFDTAPRGARDVLLGGTAGLRWFRAPRVLGTRVTITADDQGDGSVRLTGNVTGVRTGKVALYRERPGVARQAIGQTNLANGAFSFVDRPATRPILYRAVYVDPASGIPYASLLREPVN